jgi:peptidyl-prolyl cis-trans isomerase A (cyclophilin A)
MKRTSGGPGSRQPRTNASDQWQGLEVLEPRVLLSAAVADPLNDLVVMNLSGTAVDLDRHFHDSDITGTVVQFNSSLGTFYVELFNQATPITVNNFLNYVNFGFYSNSFIHRSVANFIVQGGGFIEQPPPPFSITNVTNLSGAGIQNEPLFSNTRGTIAMAKIGGNPNSATNQWFFNLGDNSANLDNQNGGFTVFGRVLGDGMDIIDAIAAIPTYDLRTMLSNSAMGELPLIDYTQGQTPVHAQLVSFTSIRVVSPVTYSIVSFDDSPIWNLADTNNDGQQDGVTIDAQGNLQLRLSGMAGSAKVRIRATDLFGGTIEDEFTIRVAPASGQMGVRDENGRVIRVQLRGPGGFSVVQNDLNGSAIESVNVVGSTLGSVLSIAPVKKGFVTLGDINIVGSTVAGLTVGGSMFRLAMTRVDLAGDLTITGVVRHIAFRDVTDGSIIISGTGSTPADAVVIRLRDVSESSIVSQIPIRMLRLAGWTDADETPDTVTAPTLTDLHVKGARKRGVAGDFQAGLTLNGTARAITAVSQAGKTFTVAGDRRPHFPVGSTVTVTGSAGNDGTYTIAAAALTAGNTVIQVQQDIPSAVVGGTIRSGPELPVLDRVRVRGDVSDASWILHGMVGRIDVKGQVENLILRAARSLNIFRAARLLGSMLFVGVKDTVTSLPDDAGDFRPGSGLMPFIGSVRVPGFKRSTDPAFVDSMIAAPDVGFVNLGLTQVDNDGAHGVAAAEFRAVTYRSSVTGLNQSVLAADVAAEPHVEEDFVVRLV